MAFVRILAALLRDKQIGRHVVPIVPDESRTFGMEGMFRQIGIYSPVGQLYQPQDSEQLMFYKEDQQGQILEQGITEAGSISSFIAAGTSYSAHNVPMIPFYIYYSMFGCQRVGDLVWAAGDSRTRGFMLGGTAGRTTLNGEGLQHEDGHSHVLFSVVPNCCAYDPTFGYEVAVTIQEGLRRMFVEQEDVFYYLTLLNENYVHPPMPDGAQEGILRGMYVLRDARGRTKTPRVQLLGSGAILREVIAAADLLANDFDVDADVWSVTSFTELRRDGIEVERCNMLHPLETPRRAYVSECLEQRGGQSLPRRTTCARSQTRSASGFPAGIARSAPTGSVAATTVGRCAGSSRSTATTSWWPPSRSSRTPARSRPPASRRRSTATRSTPRRRSRPACEAKIAGLGRRVQAEGRIANPALSASGMRQAKPNAM
jgi:pyruvate dehydrogenase E1 component